MNDSVWVLFPTFSLTLFQVMTIVPPSEEPDPLTPLMEQPGSPPELTEAEIFNVPETAPWKVTVPDEWYVVAELGTAETPTNATGIAIALASAERRRTRRGLMRLPCRYSKMKSSK